MASFCDSRPNDPSCPPAEGSDGRSGADRVEDDTVNSYDTFQGGESNPMIGNLTYLGVAVMTSVQSALHLFRYYNEADYADGLVMSSDNSFNDWSLTFRATQTYQLVIGSVLSLTQLL